MAANDGTDDGLIAALAAVGRALDLEPSHASARFNRALIIEQLGLRPLAVAAWADYLRIDATTEWAAEAREHLQVLQAEQRRRTVWRELLPDLLGAANRGDFEPTRRAAAVHPQDARISVLNDFLPRWGAAVRRGDTREATAALQVAQVIGDTLQRTNGDPMTSDIVASIRIGTSQRTLAEAHVLYGEAAAHNLARRIAPAAAKFSSVRVLFERESSPASLMSAYFYAMTAVDRGDRIEALTTLDAVGARTPASYRSLRAQMQRLRGTIFFFEGLFADALDSYQLAREEFIAIGEVQNAIDTTSRLGGAMASLGRAGEAWPTYRSAFEAAGASGAPRSMQLALHAAAFVALEEKRWDMAHALLEVEIGITDANPRVHAETIVWRVLAAQRAGFTRGASSWLNEARKGAAMVTDPDFRESALNDLRLLEALFVREESPQRSLDLLTEYIASARSRARMSRIPEILGERAAVLRRLDRDDEAERDLREAIQLIEERGSRVERDLIRDTFFGKATAPYVALSELLDARRDFAGAIEAGDLHRARILFERRQEPPVSIEALAATLPPTTALLTYGLFEDRVMLYVVRAKLIHHFESRVSLSVIEQSALRFVEAIQKGDDARAKEEGRSLFDVLIAPAASALTGVVKLVVVADTPLDRIPFAALVRPDGRFVVEEHVLSIAPAIRSYQTEVRPSTQANVSILSIGDPRIDVARYPSLPPLHDAAAEANKVASMYPRAKLLVGADATETRTASLLPQVDVAHFATHAIADPSNADNSRLLLAPSSDGLDGALTAAEIAELDLRGVDTVVLAGCRTAASGRPYGFVQNISAAFLAARARTVVGTLWDVEDRATRTFSTALHRGLRSGLPPEQALREAQLQMIGDFAIRDWSAFQIHSTN